ncbi:hypothetical protein D9757_002094 [Collybiopsis confluens]|uniref:Uncharacterized protein n=1 Tax=Collybiopsis confluens TaxID=2823264 RepID=A0A8H5MG32_9AGAR|nr:hypothetical protein D9757_002094 [Collybiopsis confluens]
MSPSRSQSPDPLSSYELHPVSASAAKIPTHIASTPPTRSQHPPSPQRTSIHRGKGKERAHGPKAHTSHSPSDSDNQEVVRASAEAMEQAVEQYRKSQITVMDALRTIRDSTDDATVAADYIAEIQHIQRDLNAAASRRSAQPQNAATTDQDEVSPEEAANAALWASLEASILPEAGAATATSFKSTSDALVQLIANSLKPTSGLSSALITAAPHLASLSTPISAPLHVQKTWKLRAVIAVESDLTPLLHQISAQSFTDPLPRALLRLIVKDQYVDFEKVHATVTQPGLIHDSKDFSTDYTLVRKEATIRSLPLSTEAQWLRVFYAWLAPLLLVYPHRKDELHAYQGHVSKYFRSSSDPTVAIRIDKEMRNLAANTPTDLSDTRAFHEVFLKEILMSSHKRPASTVLSSSSPSKRQTSACILWNQNRCPADPCRNKRRHGVCSECGEAHRAIDNDSCRAKLTARSGRTSRS